MGLTFIDLSLYFVKQIESRLHTRQSQALCACGKTLSLYAELGSFICMYCSNEVELAASLAVDRARMSEAVSVATATSTDVTMEPAVTSETISREPVISPDVVLEEPQSSILSTEQVCKVNYKLSLF